ncbi:lipoprotein insertase outer membrane protein LolB [Vibrio maerlii]|uniref:lipoprotein insertase outer membrane protein LolB n=1 Tax=Vibrio maerlii TaxID=2231648 RepID=UPI000E3E9FCF|nr:lipoprotein insertase outer membrane protein LolB [Vibrio maerlii]
MTLFSSDTSPLSWIVRKFRLLVVLSISLYLVGCATPPESETNVDWQQHQSQLQEITHFRVTGKLGYKDSEQSQSLNFIWQHSPEKSELRLTNFLGQTMLNLTTDGTSTKVDTFGGDSYTGSNPSQLIYQLTGIIIPYQQMNSWIKGVPTSNDTYTLNEQSTLASISSPITNKPWLLSYQSYMDVASTANAQDAQLPMPKSLRLTRDDLLIKLAITKWTLNP